MWKLFGKRKDRDHPRYLAINSEYASVAAHGQVFPAVSQTSQPAVQGNQVPVQASQVPVQASPVPPGEPFRSQGDGLARNNDYNGALVMYNAALRSAPNDLSLLLSRSMAHFMSEPPNLDFALKDADRVIQSNPNWWHGWLQRGQVLLQRGDLQSAEEALIKATDFAQGLDIITAQRALDDARTCRAQAPEMNSVPAPEIHTSNRSDIPLRPASTMSPLHSSASGIASQTIQSSPTAPPATLNPSAALRESGPSTALLSVTSTFTSTSSALLPRPSSHPQSMGQNVASANTANQPETRNPVNPAHPPLIGDGIRLLILRPGSFDDPIHCHLKQVSLSAGHAYEALSYVWGDASDTSPMSLGGVPYHITKNLECALRYLRHKESPRVLWVDAVCINQRNIQERNAQVTRMKDIYLEASRVITWIGAYAPVAD